MDADCELDQNAIWTRMQHPILHRRDKQMLHRLAAVVGLVTLLSGVDCASRAQSGGAPAAEADARPAIQDRLAQGAMSRFRFSGTTARQSVNAVFATGDGGTYALSSLRGRTVLVNFWASWCPPCREEMPSLAALGRRLAGEGLSVIAVSIDRQPAEARRFLGQLAIGDLAVYFDPQARAAEELGARGVPVSILLDAGGREIGRLPGTADWTSDEAILLVRAALSGRVGAPAP